MQTPPSDSAMARRPTVRAVSANVEGALPGDLASFLSVEPSHVAVTGYRRAPDGDGSLLHLREIADMDTVTKVVATGCSAARVVTPLGDDIGPAAVHEGAVVRYLGATSVLTLQLT